MQQLIQTLEELAANADSAYDADYFEETARLVRGGKVQLDPSILDEANTSLRALGQLDED